MCCDSLAAEYVPAVQEFVRVYETLRDELVADPLTAGQPEFAAQHLKQVGQTAAPVLLPVPTFAYWLE